MQVKKPFEESDFQDPQQQHIEREKKPILTTVKNSEDTHGGDESTQSIKNSINKDNQDKQNKKCSDKNNKQNKSEQKKENNRDNQNDNKKEAAKVKNESNNQNKSEQKSQVKQEATDKQLNNKSKQGQDKNKKCSDKSNKQDKNAEGKQKKEGDKQAGKSSNDKTNEKQDSQEAINNNEKNSNNESEQNKENAENQNAQDINQDKNKKLSEYNSLKVVKLEKARPSQSLSQAFYNFIELTADETKSWNEQFSDYYEPRKLMLRRYRGQSLNATKSGKIKEKIVLILDTSGSMAWLEAELSRFLVSALKRRDIDIFEAPNGDIQTRIFSLNKVEYVNHKDAVNYIIQNQLKVIYVGDYDGADTPIELSQKTKVFWLCPEDRYKHFREHDWVHYNESDFKGFFARACEEITMIEALKRFSTFYNHQQFWWDE